MRFQSIAAWGLLWALSCGTSTAGEEIALYVMDVPPMAMHTPDRKGVVGDLAVEALQRAGYTARIVQEPSNRAMLSVQNGKDALIIPLARVKEREESYTWIVPAAKVSRAFFALERPANSFAEARNRYKLVAVSRGSAGANILRENGFAPDQIYEVTQGLSAPKMLLAGRVDAWFNLVSESRLLLQDSEGHSQVKMGEPLGATFNYIACSKNCNPQLVDRLRNAAESMEQDGTAKTIRARYGRLE